GGLILSSQPRRAFYAGLTFCQAFILKFFENLEQLQPLALSIARQREAHITRFCRGVNSAREVFSSSGQLTRCRLRVLE
ncbi:hypothetical protein, partial [Pseudomonas coleopterorum]